MVYKLFNNKCPTVHQHVSQLFRKVILPRILRHDYYEVIAIVHFDPLRKPMRFLEFIGVLISNEFPNLLCYCEVFVHCELCVVPCVILVDSNVAYLCNVSEDCQFYKICYGTTGRLNRGLLGDSVEGTISKCCDSRS